VQQRVATLRRRFEGVKLIVGVDRLDYIKGVPQKLHAMEVFLEEHPEWIGKVVLVQVAVPSRQDVEEYQNLRAMVNELVGRINGRFGTVDWMPIHFMHRSVPFSELTALYTVSDACLITSTRDGMNLVRQALSPSLSSSSRSLAQLVPLVDARRSPTSTLRASSRATASSSCPSLPVPVRPLYLSLALPQSALSASARLGVCVETRARERARADPSYPKPPRSPLA